MISLSHGQAHAASVDFGTCRAGRPNDWCVVLGADAADLDQAYSARQYLPGEIVYREGDAFDGVYCLESGLVGIRKLDSAGHEILLRLTVPGDTFGYQALLNDRGHTSSAEALEASIVCFIPAAAFRKLVKTRPAIRLGLLERTLCDLAAAEVKVLEAASQSVRARFANLLWVFKDRYGAVDCNGELILNLPVSRSDMAAMIGIRPESVSRIIRAFQEEKLARFSNRRVVVPSVAVLHDELGRKKGNGQDG